MNRSEFLKTGNWPEGATLVLENRGAVHGGEKHTSINKHGLTQTDELMRLAGSTLRGFLQAGR